MSVSSVSLNSQAFGWRQADQPSAGSATDDVADSQSGSARVGGATPLMRAMMATVVVTGAQGRTETPANTDAQGRTTSETSQAAEQFAQGLMQSLHDIDAASSSSPGGPSTAYDQDLSQRIETLSQRLQASTGQVVDGADAADGSAAQADDAGSSPLPEPSTQNLIHAFTELKAAMNQPPPQGDIAQRQALSAFLTQMARSFGGSDSLLIPTGALVSVSA